jgi:hypothetical protein
VGSRRLAALSGLFPLEGTDGLLPSGLIAATAARPITLAVAVRASGRRAVDIVLWVLFVTGAAVRSFGREMVSFRPCGGCGPGRSAVAGLLPALLLDGGAAARRSRSRAPSASDARRARNVPAVPGGEGRSLQRTRARTRFPGALSACITRDRHSTVGCNRSCTALIPGPCSPVAARRRPVTGRKFQLDRRWGRRRGFIVKSL